MNNLRSNAQFASPIRFTIRSRTQSHATRLPGPATDGWRTVQLGAVRTSRPSGCVSDGCHAVDDDVRGASVRGAELSPCNPATPTDGDRRRRGWRDDRTATTRFSRGHELCGEGVRKTRYRRLPGLLRGAVWPTREGSPIKPSALDVRQPFAAAEVGEAAVGGDEVDHPVGIGLRELTQRPPDALAQEELPLAARGLDDVGQQLPVRRLLAAQLREDCGAALPDVVGPRPAAEQRLRRLRVAGQHRAHGADGDRVDISHQAPVTTTPRSLRVEMRSRSAAISRLESPESVKIRGQVTTNHGRSPSMAMQ